MKSWRDFVIPQKNNTQPTTPEYIPLEPKFSKLLFGVITLKYLLIYGVIIIPLAYWILMDNDLANSFVINIGSQQIQFNVILFTLLILYLLYSYLREAMEKSFIKPY